MLWRNVTTSIMHMAIHYYIMHECEKYGNSRTHWEEHYINTILILFLSSVMICSFLRIYS